jgi:acetyltransferase-like isoleucine patch superfamily enzyme
VVLPGVKVGAGRLVKAGRTVARNVEQDDEAV